MDRSTRTLLVALLCFVTVGLGCSTAGLLRRPAATLEPTRTPAPTFTPTGEELLPIVIITPPAGGLPGVIVVPPGVDPRLLIPTAPLPTFTPTPRPVTVTPGPSPTPSHTPTITLTPTPTLIPTPTPYIQVQSGLVNLRTGPGLAYPPVAQLGSGIAVTVVGRSAEAEWYQICCVNGESVWIAAAAVQLFNDASDVPLIQAAPPPPPTETPTATPTPTETPIVYPFQRAVGPLFYPTHNEFLTIWVRLFIGLGDPAAGYYLRVKFEGFDRPQTNELHASLDRFEFNAPLGQGLRNAYNYKYEYRPPHLDGQTAVEALGEGSWTVYVVDGAGNQLSEETTFTSAPWNPNRELYIAWQRVR